MATTVDSFIDSLGLSLEDYSRMSSLERERLYENLLKGKPAEDVSSLKENIETEIDALYEEIYVQQKELQHIIDSDKSTEIEINKAEFYLDEVDKMLTSLDSFSSEWGDAKASNARHNVDATDGQSFTFEPKNQVSNGEEFIIRAQIYAGSTDGVFEDDPEQNSDRQDILLAIGPDDALEIAHYNPDTQEVRFAVTTPDHVVYYVTVRGTPNIRLSGSNGQLTPAKLSGWPTDLLRRMYDSPATDESFLQQM